MPPAFRERKMPTGPAVMTGTWRSYGVIFGIGFAGLAFQTLLFRRFLSVFEGNELGIALFFSTWLLWVAAGAVAARWCFAERDWIFSRFEFLPLLYIPAYMVQSWLIGSAREFAGVESYELFPLAEMIPVTFLANAPISFCTGLLFSLACRWMSRSVGIPVARVYIWESVGSCVGGVVVTLLLATGRSAQTVFMYAAALLALSICMSRQKSRGIRIVSLIPFAVVILGLLTGLDDTWKRTDDQRIWRRLLPGETYGGSFVTPQATYLYGEYKGQFNVVAWESVADTIPSTEHASEVIALHLAQHPDARKILVAGPGSFSICRRLLVLPQAESITWLDTDPAYPRRLLAVLPEEFTQGAEQIEIPKSDVRRYLAGSSVRYDLMILNLPDASTLALNRYFTREFFEIVKNRLAEDGIIGVRVRGGDNFMGDELVNTGASIFHTLSAVFGSITIKPGDESWLIASDSDRLSSSPAELRDRFGSIEGADRLYPPVGILSLYLPDRIGYQLDFYKSAVEKSPPELLLNTDRKPRVLFHSLLYAAREAGTPIPLTVAIRTFAMSGLFFVPLGLCLYALLRFMYSLRSSVRRSGPAGGRIRPFDCHFLVFSGGAVSMALGIVLMFMYQSVFGSLFLEMGLVSALFMLGLSAGGFAAARILSRKKTGGRGHLLLGVGLLLHIALIIGICIIPHELSRAAFVVLFVMSGLFSGVYVPFSASQLEAEGLSHIKAGASVELSDHLGGAFGGLVTGLMLLPVFGSSYALGVTALFLGVNFLPLLTAGRKIEQLPAEQRFKSLMRQVNYLMFGIAVFLVVGSFIFNRAGRMSMHQAFVSASRSMAGGAELVEEAGESGGETVRYSVLVDTDGSGESYIFSTEKLVDGVNGYGGPIIMAVMCDRNGGLLDFRIIESNETPAYLASLKGWFKGLVGHNLFVPDVLGEVDGVTGATQTTAAVLGTLRKGAHGFGTSILGMEIGELGEAPGGSGSLTGFLVLVLLAGVALVLRRHPNFRARCVFLAAVVIVGGVYLNTQYSLAHIFSLFALKTPPVGWNSSFLLTLVLPIFVILVGNVYCGYLCPFGALQEMIGLVRPERVRTDPESEVWQYGRTGKVFLLFLLTVLFATTLDAGLASNEPLVTVFAGERARFIVVLVAAVLLLSVFFGRFWCRNLCPAGAFLSLLNGIQLFKRLAPRINSARCVFGVRANTDLDCLCCDRCRMTRKPSLIGVRFDTEWFPAGRRNLVFVVMVLVMGLVFSHRLVSRWYDSITRPFIQRHVGSGGEPRDVDMERLQHLIELRSLSVHEAKYYTPVSEGYHGDIPEGVSE